MKPKVLFFIFLILSVLFSACSAQECEGFSWERGREYAVGIKINTFETKGILTVEEDAVTFLHEDSTSPLYGMKEIFGKNEYTSLFHGMEWKSQEVKMQGEFLSEALILAESNKGWTTEHDALGGIQTERRILTDGQKSVELLILQETGKVMRLIANIEDNIVEINFGQ